MFSISEQISAITKSTFANPLTVFNALSKTAFGGIEKIIALNINTAKQSIESSSESARTLFSPNLTQESFSLHSVKVPPQIEKIVAYGRELAEISSQTGKDLLSTLTNSQSLVSTIVSQKAATPVASTPIAKVEKKLSVKTEVPSNTQLVLLAEPEMTAAKTLAPKSKAKPAASKASLGASSSEIKASKETPAVSKKVTGKKTVELKTAETSSAANAASKPVTKTLDAKSVGAKPESISTSETTTITDAPAAKKSAVKMPFPASPVKKTTKPSFPTVSTRPTYKAKGSAATGAKKPVRQ